MNLIRLSGSKALDKAAAKHPGVKAVDHDEDGYWIVVRDGWTCDPLDAHDGRADTVTEARRIISGIFPCHCNQCEVKA